MGLPMGRDPDELTCDEARPLTLGLAAALDRLSNVAEFAEAAHLPSEDLTEPMRCVTPIANSVAVSIPRECSRHHATRPESSSPHCQAAQVARRGFWGAKLTRLRGRRRRGEGTRDGLTPYSCLVPSRYLSL